MTDARQIRAATAADIVALVALWERSVRATHDFLTESDMQRGVELAISVAVEAVASLLTRGGIERRHAGQTRELRIAAKPAYPTSLDDDFSGDQCSAALQVEELGRVPGDAERDLALELVAVDSQRPTTGHEVLRDPHLDALRCLSEPLFDAIEPDLTVESPGRKPPVPGAAGRTKPNIAPPLWRARARR